MKPLKVSLLLLSFVFLTGVQAQSDGEILLPTEDFENELFTSDEPILVEDDPIVVDDEPLLVEVETEIETPEIESSSAPVELSASSLPASATKSLTVVNISQNNANALEVGARPGDILRYSFEIDSQTEDVKEYIAQINVSAMEAAVNFTDVGLGTLTGGVLSFPEFSQQAPCNKVYSFFVQIKEDCGELQNATVTADGESVRVNLNCGLSQTGPGSNGIWLWGIALLLLALGMLWQSHRRA